MGVILLIWGAIIPYKFITRKAKKEEQFLEKKAQVASNYLPFLLRSTKERHLHDFAKRNWKSSKNMLY
jgi:hypothetical protein